MKHIPVWVKIIALVLVLISVSVINEKLFNGNRELYYIISGLLAGILIGYSVTAKRYTELILMIILITTGIVFLLMK